MFFGNNGIEKVKIDALLQLLQSSFNIKLGTNFAMEINNIIKDLNHAFEEFENACTELEKIDAEPYVENLFQPNINALKDSKSAYAKSLLRVMNSIDAWDISTAKDYQNVESYKNAKKFLENVDRVTNDMLKINANFKLTIYCYASHMKQIKRAFSLMEKLIAVLRKKLENREEEYSNYIRLKEKIEQLISKDNEIAALKESIAAMKEGIDIKKDDENYKDYEKLLENFKKYKLEFEMNIKQISEIRKNINDVILPLEKPAKKFDHISHNKLQLHKFITDFIETIKTEKDYSEFISLIKELQNTVKLMKIDIKNYQEVDKDITKIFNLDLYSMVKKIRALHENNIDIENSIKETERVIKDITNMETDFENVAVEMHGNEKELNDIINSRESTKKIIEQFFLTFYRKKISIVN
jgi:exonuclease VII small subunit